MDIEKLMGYWKSLTLGSALALALAGNYFGYWVTGPVYKAMVDERDEWKGLYVKALNLSNTTPSGYVGGVSTVAKPSDSLDTARAKVKAKESL